MRFDGIYTPLITPFTAELAIDSATFARIIDEQIAAGVAGLIIGGSTGEFYALTPAERTRQFEMAAGTIDHRVAFVAGVNELRTADCLDITAAARDAGADALLVAAPPYSQPSATDLAAHVRAIDRVAKLPIMLYNYPARTGASMDNAFLEDVSGLANVVAIKESSGDLSRIHALVTRFPTLQLVAGAEDLVLEFFAWGARSWVSVVANFMPEQAVAFHRICVREGDFERGRRVMRALLPLMHCLEHGGAFIQSVKLACEARGRPGGPVRPPLLSAGPQLAGEVRRVVGSVSAEVDNILAA